MSVHGGDDIGNATGSGALPLAAAARRLQQQQRRSATSRRRRVPVEPGSGDADASRSRHHIWRPADTGSREEVLRILSAAAGVQFQGSDILEWSRPVVYLAFRNGEPLYVGVSDRGIGRLFDKQHLLLKKLAPEDHLQVWAVSSTAEAKRLEVLLIDRLQPRFNRRGKMSALELRHRLGLARRPSLPRRSRESNDSGDSEDAGLQELSAELRRIRREVDRVSHAVQARTPRRRGITPGPPTAR